MRKVTGILWKWMIMHVGYNNFLLVIIENLSKYLTDFEGVNELEKIYNDVVTALCHDGSEYFTVDQHQRNKQVLKWKIIIIQIKNNSVHKSHAYMKSDSRSTIS